MRALKVLVIVMGVLLVAGSVALVLAGVYRVHERRAAAPAAPPALAPRSIALPAGAHIVATELVGDRLLLRLALADGSEQLWLLDARSGSLVATIGASTKP